MLLMDHMTKLQYYLVLTQRQTMMKIIKKKNKCHPFPQKAFVHETTSGSRVGIGCHDYICSIVATVTIWYSQALHKCYPNHLDITNFNKMPTDTSPIVSDKTKLLSLMIKSLLFILTPLLHIDCNCHPMSSLPFVLSYMRQILTQFLCTKAVGLSISHH